MTARGTPRPKGPSAHDAYAEIRRRRDEICRVEGRKPPEPFPEGKGEGSEYGSRFPPSVLDDAVDLDRLYVETAELYMFHGYLPPHGLDMSEGAE